MNENIDWTKILKDCPKGTKLYSTIYGEVRLTNILHNAVYPIIVSYNDCDTEDFTADGKLREEYDGECTLFPSKDQRDWSKFSTPWYKKGKFDPKTLNPFDRILVRNHNDETWSCNFFSHIREAGIYKFTTITSSYKQCVPYNDNTKHLTRTTNEAPEYYRYWEE